MNILCSCHKSCSLSDTRTSLTCRDNIFPQHFKTNTRNGHKHTAQERSKLTHLFMDTQRNISHLFFFFFSYRAHLKKEGGNAICSSQRGAVHIRVQVTSANLGCREWQKPTTKTLSGLRRRRLPTHAQREVTLLG